jgi:hypothetical protein
MSIKQKIKILETPPTPTLQITPTPLILCLHLSMDGCRQAPNQIDENMKNETPKHNK